MKFLLILLILQACGKHDEPNAKDLRDLDGDQIPNAYEVSDFDKQVANLSPLGNVQAELRLKQGRNTEVISTIEFENTIDISSYTKDLMVQNIHSLPVDDYFSQYSLLRIKIDKSSTVLTQAQIYGKLTIKGTNERLDLTLIDKTNAELLGTFKDTIDFELSKEKIEKILRGEAFLAISRNEISQFNLPSQEETVKAKTYRVFYDNGLETKIFYVSKDLSFDDFLILLQIDKTHKIEEVDLLSTDLTFRMPLWWVRNLNEHDKVLVKEDVKHLSTHYLNSLHKSNVNVSRENGVAKVSLNLLKHPKAKALIKIRASRVLNSFKESGYTASYSYESSYRDNTLTVKCDSIRREIVTPIHPQVDEGFLRNTLRLVSNDAVFSNYKLLPGHDGKGAFWELQVPPGVVKFDAYLENLPADTYTLTGTYSSNCKQTGSPYFMNYQTNFESQLNFFLETYVEKIKE